MIPDAEYLYACDEKWWRFHIGDVRKTFKGELYTQWHNKGTKKFAEDFGLKAIEGRHNPGLGEKLIHFNSTSGAQAINMAYLFGATKIILLGYDMGPAGGKNHWFGDHPGGMTNGINSGQVSRYDKLAADLKQEGVEVINCSRRTNLTQFKRSTIDKICLNS